MAKNVWAQLNNLQNLDLTKGYSIEISVESQEPTEKSEVAFEDLRMLWKDQTRIEEGKVKAKQKQKDIKKKVSNAKQARRNDENKLRELEVRL